MEAIRNDTTKTLTASDILSTAVVKRKSEAWIRLNAMADNAAKVNAMTNTELCTALRNFGDNIPMNELAYDLIEEAAIRLEKLP